MQKKNRALQVKFVKTADEAGNETTTEMDPSETIAQATMSVKEIMQEGVKMLAVWVAMDTGRKVLLALINK